MTNTWMNLKQKCTTIITTSATEAMKKNKIHQVNPNQNQTSKYFMEFKYKLFLLLSAEYHTKNSYNQLCWDSRTLFSNRSYRWLHTLVAHSICACLRFSVFWIILFTDFFFNALNMCRWWVNFFFLLIHLLLFHTIFFSRHMLFCFGFIKMCLQLNCIIS